MCVYTYVCDRVEYLHSALINKKVLLPTPSISFLVVCLPPAGKYSCDDSVKPQLFGHRAHRVHLKNKVYKEL